jgi:hypothetical protein
LRDPFPVENAWLAPEAAPSVATEHAVIREKA